MEEFDLEVYKQWYTSAWKGALRQLLRWEPAAIETWLTNQLTFLDMESTYHETPAYDIIPELIPHELKKTLTREDLRELESRVEKAFTAGQRVWPGNEGYDWALAKEKINTVLAQYGSSLP